MICISEEIPLNDSKLRDQHRQDLCSGYIRVGIIRCRTKRKFVVFIKLQMIAS